MKFSKTFVPTLAIVAVATQLQAQEVEYDASIERAAIENAKNKIGAELRESIPFDEKPVIVELSAIQPEIKKRQSDYFGQLPRMTSVADQPTLAQLADEIPPGVDMTITGSVPAHAKRLREPLVWDKFDSEGNLIK